MQKIQNNADYNASTLFDSFEISSNSLIDKVINYVFPADQIYETFLRDTIKRVKLLELQREYKQVQEQLRNSITDNEKYLHLAKLKELTDKINKEK